MHVCGLHADVYVWSVRIILHICSCSHTNAFYLHALIYIYIYIYSTGESNISVHDQMEHDGVDK